MDELVTILGIDVASGAQQKIDKFNSTLDGIVKAAGWMAAGLLTAAGSIGFFAERSANAGAAIEKFHQITGISTDTLQEMQFAVEQVGGSADALTNDLASLSKSMSSPIPGEYNNVLFMLGINTKKWNGELKTSADVFMEMADKMKGKNPIEMTQWLSRAGMSNDSVLLLMKGREAIQKLTDEARKLPVIVGDQQLKNLLEFETRLSMIRRIFTYLGQEISSAAGPALRDIVESLTNWLKLNKEIIQTGLKEFIDGIVNGFKKFGEILSDVIEYFQKTFPKINEFTKNLDRTKLITEIVTGLLVALTAVLGVLAIKLLIVYAPFIAVGLAVKDFIDYLRGGDSVIGSFMEKIGKMADEFAQKFPAITEIFQIMGMGIENYLTHKIENLNNSLSKAFELFDRLKSNVQWLLDKDEKILEFMGFGQGKISSGTKSLTQPLTVPAGASGSWGLQKSGASGGWGEQKNTTINQKNEWNIMGGDSLGIAAAVGTKLNYTMQQIYPGMTSLTNQ